MSSPVVRWINGDTGEIKERTFSGVEIDYIKHGSNPVLSSLEEVRTEWEATALELALALIPDLVAEIDRARVLEQSIEIKVQVVVGSSPSNRERKPNA